MHTGSEIFCAVALSVAASGCVSHAPVRIKQADTRRVATSAPPSKPGTCSFTGEAEAGCPAVVWAFPKVDSLKGPLVRGDHMIFVDFGPGYERLTSGKPTLLMVDAHGREPELGSPLPRGATIEDWALGANGTTALSLDYRSEAGLQYEIWVVSPDGRRVTKEPRRQGHVSLSISDEGAAYALDFEWHRPTTLISFGLKGEVSRVTVGDADPKVQTSLVSATQTRAWVTLHEAETLAPDVAESFKRASDEAAQTQATVAPPRKGAYVVLAVNPDGTIAERTVLRTSEQGSILPRDDTRFYLSSGPGDQPRQPRYIWSLVERQQRTTLCTMSVRLPRPELMSPGGGWVMTEDAKPGADDREAHLGSLDLDHCAVHDGFTAPPSAHWIQAVMANGDAILTGSRVLRIRPLSRAKVR